MVRRSPGSRPPLIVSYGTVPYTTNPLCGSLEVGISAASRCLLREGRPNCSELSRTAPGTEVFRTVPIGNTSGTLRNTSSADFGEMLTCQVEIVIWVAHCRFFFPKMISFKSS